MKTKYFLFILLIITSCGNQVTILYYYNGNINNGKYILASDLKSFFLDNNDIKKVSIKDQKVKEEISQIKEKIILKNNIVVPDDSYYVFAFISKKDTIFADNSLVFWRYKDKGVAYKLNDTSKNIILKQYKLNPNQQ